MSMNRANNFSPARVALFVGALILSGSDSALFNTRTAFVQRPAHSGEPLGLVLSGRFAHPVLVRVAPGSAAAACHCLQPGDMLLRVQGQYVFRTKHSDVLDALKAANSEGPWPLRLELLRISNTSVALDTWVGSKTKATSAAHSTHRLDARAVALATHERKLAFVRTLSDAYLQTLSWMQQALLLLSDESGVTHDGHNARATAVSLLRRAASHNPMCALCHYNLGMLGVLDPDAELKLDARVAVEHLTTAAALEPTNAATYLWLSHAMSQLKRNRAALAAARRWTELVGTVPGAGAGVGAEGGTNSNGGANAACDVATLSTKLWSWAAQDARVCTLVRQPKLFQQCGAFEVQYLSPPPPLRLLRSAAQRRVTVQSLSGEAAVKAAAAVMSTLASARAGVRAAGMTAMKRSTCKRLRIGYLFSHFKGHAVMLQLRSLFRRHEDHTCTSATAVKGEHSCNIDVYALALKNHHASQQYMQMKKSLGSRFVEVSGGGSGLHGARHRAVVIAQLGLDILISLNGLPDSGAEPLLSLCPALLTINAFGSLGTMGGGPTDVKIDTAEQGKVHSVGARWTLSDPRTTAPEGVGAAFSEGVGMLPISMALIPPALGFGTEIWAQAEAGVINGVKRSKRHHARACARVGLWGSDLRAASKWLPGLRPGAIVYGAFNKAQKIDSQTLDTWAALLRQSAHAVLVLQQTGSTARALPDNIEQQVRTVLSRSGDDLSLQSEQQPMPSNAAIEHEFAARGVRAKLCHPGGEGSSKQDTRSSGKNGCRVYSVPPVAHSEHLRRIHDVVTAGTGVFLDTPLYGAHSTALDVLWAGAPIVTISLGGSVDASGRAMSRATAAMVASAGSASSVAHSWRDYEDTSLRVTGSDAARHSSAIAAGLRASLSKRTFFKRDRWVRAYEHTLRAMFEVERIRKHVTDAGVVNSSEKRGIVWSTLRSSTSHGDA